MSHHCDKAATAAAKALEPLHLKVPVEKRYAGGYVLAVHRNLEGAYVLREMVLEEGRVLAENVLGEPESWDVVAGMIQSEAVERFTP